MSLQIREVGHRKDLKRFIYLPERIHRHHPTWVPPLYTEERRHLDPRRNRAFSYCDTILLLAWRGKRVVGRIMGIINSRHNAFRGEKTARFACLETWEDREVVHALLSRVEEWARSRGMARIVGPFGFSDQDPEGFLVEGFEHRATIATYHNFPWMPGLVEGAGYVKDVDYFVYRIQVPEEAPEVYNRIIRRVQRSGGFQLIEFTRRRELRPWIKPAFQLLNESFAAADIYGFAPMDEEEMDLLAKRYLPIVDPRFLKGVIKDGQIVAFVIGIPDMTEGFQRARGRLFPFGIFHIMRAAKRTRQLDLLLGAIKEGYRGLGLDALLALQMRISAIQAGFRVVDTHHEMESNVKVRSLMEKFGGERYKRFRVYQKSL